MSSYFVPMSTILPPGRLGSIELKHITVTEEQARFDRMRAACHGLVGIKAGTHCRLTVHGTMMMSDGPNEYRTNTTVVYEARGDVLIAGLGLGMILVPILKKPDVRSVKVIEKYPEVISLVMPRLCDHLGKDAAKLSVVEGDIFNIKPKPGEEYDTIYFDIWPSLCEDNLPGGTKLKRRWARCKREGGWMGCWGEAWIRAHRR